MIRGRHIIMVRDMVLETAKYYLLSIYSRLVFVHPFGQLLNK